MQGHGAFCPGLRLLTVPGRHWHLSIPGYSQGFYQLLHSLIMHGTHQCYFQHTCLSCNQRHSANLDICKELLFSVANTVQMHAVPSAKLSARCMQGTACIGHLEEESSNMIIMPKNACS